MTDFPWLSALILLPLVGAVVTGLVPRSSAAVPTQVALVISLLTFAGAVSMATGFTLDGGMQFEETHPWIAALGVHYAVGVDGLGLLMLLLTTALVPLVLAAAPADAADGRPSAGPFAAWVLALEAMSIAVFAATDVFVFYVVFEATLIPAYFLISGFGGPGRSRAAMKFLIYQLAGGLIMLASVIGLYVASANRGTPSYLLTDLAGLDLSSSTQRWLFVGFFIAFAIKAPMFPVHTWLADTTEQATPGTSVLLVCILDKIGTFGMLRYCLGLFPDASRWATPVVVVLALISIIYGALVAIGQDNLLRLIGLTSLSHFGFIVLGIFVFTGQGSVGAVLYMVNHGIATAALFLVAGAVIARSGTASLSAMRGMERATPLLAGLLLTTGLAACGLPGLAPFVSEFLVLVAAFSHAWWVGAVAVLAIVLAAIYVLWMYQRMMTGPTPAPVAAPSDVGGREVGVLAPLLVALVVFGLYPMPLLNVINPYVQDTLQEVGVTDPVPTVPASAQEGGH